MLERANHLRDSAQMQADPFSEILKLTRAESLVTGGFSAGGSWAIRFPAPDKIKFFAVVKGGCWVHIEGEPAAVRFETGDVGLLAVPRATVLASAPDVAPVDAMSVFSRAGRTTATLGDGEDFAHIGGHVLLDRASGRLLADVLPPWIHIRAVSPQARAFRWVLDQLVEERAHAMPGGQLASAQLSQLLFIQILRAHLQACDPMPAGWLRGLADPRLAPALRMMHGEPARAWHLDDLARACAMSRTSFALRFRTAVGVAPLAYLTAWRMRLAERALREEGSAVAVVAHSLGYTSESAFSNAFKRINGRSPKAWRHADRRVRQQVGRAESSVATGIEPSVDGGLARA
ncbi:AraC family transcriptional regulator [Rhizobacter sp. SG703]|uniref:AraC family transcriptional regulator n=1 Tax=Rhizobacter sp. SG703 TaxID=2587140 RepID=UPI001447E828|nr:AraC family transcriptional regulator [Rhizobacter sp. SG703]